MMGEEQKASGMHLAYLHSNSISAGYRRAVAKHALTYIVILFILFNRRPLGKGHLYPFKPMLYGTYSQVPSWFDQLTQAAMSLRYLS